MATRLATTHNGLVSGLLADPSGGCFDSVSIRRRRFQRGMRGTSRRSSSLHSPQCVHAILMALILRAFTLACALVPRACMSVDITPLSENDINNFCVKNNFCVLFYNSIPEKVGSDLILMIFRNRAQYPTPGNDTPFRSRVVLAYGPE